MQRTLSLLQSIAYFQGVLIIFYAKKVASFFCPSETRVTSAGMASAKHVGLDFFLRRPLAEEDPSESLAQPEPRWPQSTFGFPGSCGHLLAQVCLCQRASPCAPGRLQRACPERFRGDALPSPLFQGGSSSLGLLLAVQPALKPGGLKPPHPFSLPGSLFAGSGVELSLSWGTGLNWVERGEKERAGEGRGKASVWILSPPPPAELLLLPCFAYGIFTCELFGVLAESSASCCFLTSPIWNYVGLRLPQFSSSHEALSF